MFNSRRVLKLSTLLCCLEHKFKILSRQAALWAAELREFLTLAQDGTKARIEKIESPQRAKNPQPNEPKCVVNASPSWALA